MHSQHNDLTKRRALLNRYLFSLNNRCFPETYEEVLCAHRGEITLTPKKLKKFLYALGVFQVLIVLA